MRWTEARPTMPGYYWFKNAEFNHHACIVFIYLGVGCVLHVELPYEHVKPLIEVNGEWAGPIPEPED